MPLITIQAPKQPIYEKDSDTYSWWKVAVISVLSGIFAAVTSFLVSGDNRIWALIPFVFFLAFFVLKPLLIRRFPIAVLAMIVDTLAFAAPIFIMGNKTPPVIFISGAAVMFLLFVVGYRRGKAEEDNSIKIKFSKISRAVFPGLFAGIAVFISLIIGFSFTPADLLSHNFLDPMIRVVMDPALAAFASGVNSNATLNQFADVFAKQKLVQASSAEEFANIPEDVRNSQIAAISPQVITSLSGTLGTELDGKVSILENIYKIIVNKLKNTLDALPVE